MSESEPESIPAQRANAWQRVDHLRSMPKESLTDWEWSFLDSLHAQRERYSSRDRARLSEKQTAVINKLWAKHCNTPLLDAKAEEA